MTANLAAKKAFRVGGTVLATLLVVLLVLNLSLGDQRVDYRIEHAYDVREPLFQRTMGRVLAPGFVEGNSIETLHNGEEIFPAMLEAIRLGQAHDHIGNLHLLFRRDCAPVRRCPG
jgi:cardiolipin synthase